MIRGNIERKPGKPAGLMGLVRSSIMWSVATE